MFLDELTPIRRRVAAAFASVAILVAVLVPATPGRAADQSLTLDHGHVDAFAVMMVDGAPALRLQEDVTGSHVVHNPEDVNLVVKQDALTSFPDSEFLPPDTRGKDMYYLPLNQDQNLLWPGWDSQALAGTGFDQVDINIQAVDGPGQVFLWSSGVFGDLQPILADGGYALPNTIRQSFLGHVHANWAFSAPGKYYLTVQAEAINSTTGARQTTNTASYLFTVGNVLPVPTSVTIDGLQNPYAENAPINLTARTDVEVTEATYVWETRTGEGAWQPVGGQTSPTFTGTASVDRQQIRVHVTAGETTLTSEAVTIDVTDPGPPLPTSLVVTGASESYQDGSPIALTATPDVDVNGAIYRWETKNPGADWKITAGQTSAQYSGIADTAGQLIRASLIHNGEVMVTSFPVTIVVDKPTDPGSCWALDIDHGHVDAFAVMMDDGAPALRLQEAVTGSRVVHNPEDVNLVVKPASLTALPNNSAVPPALRGQQVYYLSQNEDANLLWPGWDSQGLAGGGFDKVDVAITDVNGPGTVSIWSIDALGGLRSLLADGGYSLPNTIRQDYLAHVHANWAFSKPGIYRFTVTATAINSDTGERRATNTGTYLFTVGDVKPGPGDKECPDPSPSPTTSPSSSPSGTPSTSPPTTTPSVSTTPSVPTQPSISAKPSTTAPSCIPVKVTTSKIATTAPNSQIVVGSEGHFDFGPMMQDGTLNVLVKDDRGSPPTYRNPDTIVFALGDKALRRANTVPSALSFIAPAGQDVYMIQQVQESGVPWLGWNTQHESIVNGLNNASATMRLDKVEGPGKVAVFMSGNFGSLVGQRVMDNVGGPTSYTIPANTHQHGNWVFTKPGQYAVTITITAGGHSDTATLRFAVGVPASATSTSASPVSTVVVEGRTDSGQKCTLPTTGVSHGLSAVAVAGGIALLAGIVIIAATTRRRWLRVPVR